MEPPGDGQASEEYIMFKERRGNEHEAITVVSLLFVNLVIHFHHLALRILMSSQHLWGFLIGRQKMALMMGLFQAETRDASEDAATEEEGKYMAVETAREGKESDERLSATNVEYSMDVEASEAAEDGYF